MKIAIIGAGISGLTCAHKLHQAHDICVFEKSDRIGGHTATIDFEHHGKPWSIDTGFIVFNDWTYPHFMALLQELEVDYQPSEMSFSVNTSNKDFEYAGSNFRGLFAQKRNLFNIPYLNMLKNIMDFNLQAVADLEGGHIAENVSLGEYLEENRYGKMFQEYYLIPMGSAIWSSSLDEILQFPLLFFVRFFKNHGLLSLKNRPQWYVIKGGSRSYLAPLTKAFKERIQTHSAIRSVARQSNHAFVNFADGTREVFDQVVFACHSDQALALLSDPQEKETAILSALPYRENDVVLHTDISLLPKRKRAWASWNYHLGADRKKPATLSYNMNILQGIKCKDTFVVTLNSREEIDPTKIIGAWSYAHPVFSLDGIKAQNQWAEINGTHNTWFCGAYWRNGFHEDGCQSGIRVAEAIAEKNSC